MLSPKCEKEGDDMFYSRETIDLVKSISALQYMLDWEPHNLKKVGQVYFYTIHDSLYFSNGFYRWASHGSLGGKTALRFLQDVEEMSFMDAMERLCDLYNIIPNNDMNTNLRIKQQIEQRNAEVATISQSRTEDTVFELPKAAPNNKRVYAYLKKRGISDRVIRDCLQSKILYQEKNHGNCVFVGYDYEGKPAYAAMRSTGYGEFRIDASGSNKTYPFRILNESSDTVHLFEAPVDMLSFATYMQLKGYDYKKTNLMSLAGVSKPPENGPMKIHDGITELLKQKKVSTFCLHFDNDNIGILAAEGLGEVLIDKGFNVYNSPVPKEYGKDVNDFLLNYLKKSEEKKIEKGPKM